MKEKWDLLGPMARKQWIGQMRGTPLPIFFSKWDELTVREQSMIESFLNDSDLTTKVVHKCGTATTGTAFGEVHAAFLPSA